MNPLAIAEHKLATHSFDEAEHFYNLALNESPLSDRALFGLGCVYTERGNYGLAAACYRSACDVNEKNLSAVYNLAAVLTKLREKDKAREIYASLAETVERSPIPNKERFLSDIYGNWSGMYVNAGEPAEAMALARKGLKYGDSLDCHNHLALGLMETGQWEKAMPHWERRLERREFHRREYAPVWNGEKTDTLVIHGEQGIGDEIMFLSALNEIRSLARNIVVEANPRLMKVIQRSFDLPCYAGAELMENCKPTAQIAMGSLFLSRRKAPQDCPGTPYLKANPEYVAEYSSRLSGFKVGIAWKGGTEKTHSDVRRIPLSAWSPILSQGHTFVSLQYGDVAAEADRNGLIHYQYAIDDIERQVALIQSLDLVITTCQSVVHFAGALGKPVWCLTPSKARWCYGMSGEAMPLYSSVKLYRQEDSWTEVVERVADDLQALNLKVAA